MILPVQREQSRIIYESRAIDFRTVLNLEPTAFFISRGEQEIRNLDLPDRSFPFFDISS